MNYHCFLSLQVFESPYFSKLPRSVSPAGSLALSRLFLFSSAGTRSAPHSHALFAASGARAAADILAIFFTPPPLHSKAQITAPASRCTVHSPSWPPILHLVPFREQTSADKPLHIDPQLAPVPGIRIQQIFRYPLRLAVLFLFILDNSRLFTHFPQRETVDIQRFHALTSGSFPQFSHIFHAQRQPPG